MKFYASIGTILACYFIPKDLWELLVGFCAKLVYFDAQVTKQHMSRQSSDALLRAILQECLTIQGPLQQCLVVLLRCNAKTDH